MASRVSIMAGAAAVGCITLPAVVGAQDTARTPRRLPGPVGHLRHGNADAAAAAQRSGDPRSRSRKRKPRPSPSGSVSATSSGTRRATRIVKPRQPAETDRVAPPVTSGGYNTFWIDRGAGAFQIDGQWRTSIITDPEDGRQPPRTDEARAAAAARAGRFRANTGVASWITEGGPDAPGPYDDPEIRPLAERCLLGFSSTGGPPMLPALYNNLKRIVQTEDHVMILVEMVHDARIIRLNAEHDPPELPQVARRLGRPLGGRHARRRHDELHRSAGAQRRLAESARRGAVHTRRRRHAPVPFHG